MALLLLALALALSEGETVRFGATSPAPAGTTMPSPEPSPDPPDEGTGVPFAIEDLGPAPGKVPEHWSWVGASDGSFRVISGGRASLEVIPGGWVAEYSVTRGRIRIYIYPTDAVDRPSRYARLAHLTWLEGIADLEDIDVTGRVEMRGADGWEATGRLGGRSMILRTLWADGRLYHLSAAFYDADDARRRARTVLSSFTVRGSS